MISRPSFWDEWSQYTLRVTSECPLRCRDCMLWRPGGKPDKKEGDKIVDLIRKGRFFTVFPKRRIYNIVGGEPLEEGRLFEIVSFLTRNEVRVRLWTNGFYTSEYLRPSLPYIHDYFVFLPAPHRDMYRELTGTDGWDRMEGTLDFLIEERRQPVLHIPVHTDTVQFLPDAYEFAWQKKVPLWVHYEKNGEFESESKAYIRWMRNVPFIAVLPKRHRVFLQYCRALPYPAYQDPLQSFQIRFFQGVASLRHKLNKLI